MPQWLTRIAVQTLLDSVHALLGACHDGEATRFARQLPEHIDVLRPTTPHQQPVVDWLGRIGINEPAPDKPSLLTQLQSISAALTWSQSYTREQISARFLARYAWTELVGPRGPIANNRLVCGFLLLGPEIEYPQHAHAPEELYVPLTEGSQWQMGSDDWTDRAADRAIYHAPWITHAMRTGQQPMVAVYLWRDGDFTQSPTFNI